MKNFWLPALALTLCLTLPMGIIPAGAVNSATAVEAIQAHAGMDIGGTLIGMHLKRVAVPVRLSLDHIGHAILLCARTRPKLIGGERAKYTEED